jgi:hypothetical protein
MSARVDGWKVTDVRTGVYSSMFGGAGRPYVAATLEHETGATMGVSRYPDEPGWGVDSAVDANGAPRWVNGEGARYLSVRMLDDGPVTDALDTAAADITRV